MRVSKVLAVCGLMFVAGEPAYAGDVTPDLSKRSVVAQAQTMCTEVELPVCATKDGKRVQYGNDCKAKRAGATDITAGPCLATK
jgi:hypothetical protein